MRKRIARLTDAQCDLAASGFVYAQTFARFRCRPPWNDHDFTLGAACEGVVHAAARWKPGRASFKTFCYFYMKAYLRRAILSDRMIHIPAYSESLTVFATRGFAADAADAKALKRRAFIDNLNQAKPTAEMSRETRLVREAIETLDERERELVNRVKLKGDQLGDVSESMGITRKISYRILRQSLAKIKAFVEAAA